MINSTVAEPSGFNCTARRAMRSVQGSSPARESLRWVQGSIPARELLRWVQGSIPARELCFESHLLLYSKPRGYRSRHFVTHEDRFLSVL